MASPILKPARSVEGYSIAFYGWCICRIATGDDELKHATPIEWGFASEALAEQAFRERYAEQHPRGIHGNGSPRIIRERDLLGE